MKRSRSIKLALLGGLSMGALTGCSPKGSPASPSSVSQVYTNNYYVPKLGYYHAPFRGWYQFPYNHFDPATQRYFYGGQWAVAPCQTITNISSPTVQAARMLETARPSVYRGGWGSSGRSHGIYC